MKMTQGRFLYFMIYAYTQRLYSSRQIAKVSPMKVKNYEGTGKIDFPVNGWPVILAVTDSTENRTISDGEKLGIDF
ncbi:hypothetical protein [Paenibacillus eucommiae]|uniref:Uncharacterized protein n=1 Tax=Paenibacillus eucommiae TaxID=1355755 RepID=A0ABS4J5X0_9BACL|nr:hypothetical protein [Paenibacillus eucommiae]MBP1994666.1 hypothetical protein [Paenibacillus eucommiae]